METQISNGNLPPFAACLGSWRPDFLVEDYRAGRGDQLIVENFSITEINARFSFNGFMHEAYGQRAVDDRLREIGVNIGARALVSATNPETVRIDSPPPLTHIYATPLVIICEFQLKELLSKSSLDP